jgi:glycosyltransferase involved in cell wall biosynthesis
MQSLVSILIPAYNVEQYICQCLDSILAQTYQTLQVVVIDDGSIDNTFAVCQEYARRDSRIELYHQENQGVAQTRNHLLEKVRGDYTLFVDSDDWIEKDMIEGLVFVAYSKHADMVLCENVKNVTFHNEIQHVIKELSQEEAIRDFLRHQYFTGSLWNKLLKSSLLHNEYFRCGIWYGEDALFCWNLLQKVNSVVVTNDQYYHYRMNDSSISHQSYSEKKMSGHQVWRQIFEDTRMKWPQFATLAQANYAISDMWQIYFAAKSNYPKDDNIKAFQDNVRKNLLIIYKSELINCKKKLFATIAAFCYNACKWMLKLYISL